jgi:hypothetical protein
LPNDSINPRSRMLVPINWIIGGSYFAAAHTRG